jgi:hypothetical protein
MNLTAKSVPQHSVLHPPYCDQVIERLEQTIAHAVLGQAVNAGVVTDGNLRHCKPVHERESGKEPVHTLEQANALQHWPSKDFEGTRRIVDAVMSEEVSHAVGDQG